ncbi:ABC transporter permease [Sulfobacillus harzensis]|uniref:ABC transporter permease n=1 Tax=Sulfobacillus harzensis TaxID=2729629 RepID=A0A7Y0L299_9FIRM|nr:ABC transporter permease [Sulfobacillus harzensis]NMP21987.1 ABC transporter permease [Sulfobacillus harzensis]
MTAFQVAAVFRREWEERARRAGYWVTTVIGMVVMVALVVLPGLITSGIHPTQTVGSVGVPRSVLVAVKPPGVHLNVQAFPSYRKAANQVTQHNLTGFFERVNDRLVFYGDPNGTVAAMISALDQKGLDQGIPAAVAAQIQRAAATTSVKLVPLAPGIKALVHSSAIYALNIVMMILVMTYGVFIGMSVAEEKESRHAEMLMAWITPRPLMVGKILGFAALAFVQLALWALAGFVALAIKHQGQAFGITPGLVGLFLLWTSLGYLEFSTAFTALAARAQRSADLNQAVMPISLVAMVGYLGSMLASAHPSGIWASLLHIGAFVPFLAPFLGFALLQLGGMPWWQVAIDALWQIVFWWLLLGFAGRLFHRHLLRFKSGRLTRSRHFGRGKPPRQAGADAS